MIRVLPRFTQGLFKSLYWRISATFLALLVVLALVYVYITAFSAEMYFQEANQRINTTVAEHIAQRISPFMDEGINEEALQETFHNIVLTNPSIELYLLDTKGKILSYYAPNKNIQLGYVSLKPIEQFIREQGQHFVMGDDPKHVHGEKVFAAAPITVHASLKGYLYVILGSEEYDSAAEMLLGSYILRLGTRAMIITLVAAIAIGLIAIGFITKSLRIIIRTVREFQNGNFEARIALPSKGEMTELATAFNTMANTIVRNIEEIKTMDTLRRELIANVSHDLRTPLASIHGYVETVLMKKDSLNEEDLHRYLMTVLDSTEKLSKLVEELFELSNLEAKQTKPKLEPFSIAELVQDVTQKFQVLAQQHTLSIQTILPHDLPLVTGDIALIERVLQNLLDNAVKYTPEGGAITIELQRLPDVVGVKIADTGYGIAPEDLPFVFERYHKGEKRELLHYNGIGLGLAIVKKILEAHSITISATSTVRQGTAFSFQLPIHA